MRTHLLFPTLLLLSLSSTILPAFSHPHPHPHSHRHHAPLPAAPVPAPIATICARTDYPDICIAAARPHAHTVPTLDAASVLSLLVQAATDHTKATRNVAARIAGKVSMSDMAGTVLADCQTNYGDALDNLASGMMAVARKDKATANIMFSAAISDYNTCEQGFMEMPGLGPMTQYDELLVKMASNCLAVLALI